MHIDFSRMRLKSVANRHKDMPNDGIPEIAMAGRSNSGKSSLINALARQKKLARTSSSPGKTRLAVFFEIPDVLRIADLPGYGYASASRQTVQNLSNTADAYFSSGRPLRLVLLLLDCR